jgi:hypothetical protein
MSDNKLKVIVIHGNGATYLEIIEKILSILVFKSVWQDGIFYIERKDANLIRNILFNPPDNPFIEAMQMVIVSRLLLSCFKDSKDVDFNMEHANQIKESRIIHEFSKFGIPSGALNRQSRAKQMLEEAKDNLTLLETKLNYLKEILVKPSGEILFESDAGRIISDALPTLQDLLDKLRSMPESGGDLDTVASATFYTYWLKKQAIETGKECIYGIDYIYAFVNYHDSLKFLEKYGPADVLMADMPIAALPTFEHDLIYLASKNIHFLRVEDHHPYGKEHVEMFERLQANNMLDFYEMAGPLHNEEQQTKDMRCGADVVFDNLIKGTKNETDGARDLKYWTHCTDLAIKKTEDGELLTTLIKGGLCKVELAQNLVTCIHDNSFTEMFHLKKWNQLADDWDEQFIEIQEQLQENCYISKFERKDNGTDENNNGHTSVLFALAVARDQDKAKIPVNKAVGYLSRSYPEADYVFYCYGASLMVARRTNQDDLTFNLGEIMKAIGSPSDGGHSGAAVCKPDSNPNYPRQQLKRVTKSNFHRFCKYMSMRFNNLGYKNIKLSNSSMEPSSGNVKKGNKKLIVIIVITMTLGFLLTALSSKFRRPNVLYTNRNFYQNLETPDEKAIIEQQEILHKQNEEKQ